MLTESTTPPTRAATTADVSPPPWTGAPWAPRRWQAEAFPLVLAAARSHKRGLVSAIMGSGKSILQAEIAHAALHRARGRAVVLSAPRQQLVRQLAGTVRTRLGSRWSVGTFYADEKDSASDVIVSCNASLPALVETLGERRVAMLVLDEAHGSEAERVRAAAAAARPTVLVGFTATPFRSVPRESLSLYDEVVYRYTLEQAIEDGCLVPPRVVRWGGAPGVSVDEACEEMIRQHGHGPGIVSASTIEDAERYAAWLTSRGLAAEAIHSGHSAKERDDKIARVQAGELLCLVHVSLLAEGVDFPWLRWLCLRRHVSARVRFIQEIGRVLRSHPGKTEGVILDPHLLLGKHGLDAVERLGEVLLAAAKAEEQEEPAVGGEREARDHEVVAMEALSEFLGRLRDALEVAGVCEARWTDDMGDGWRLAAASKKQVETIRKVKTLTRHVPTRYRDPLKALLSVPYALNRGEVSDLLDVLIRGARFARDNQSSWCEDKPWMATWPADLVDVPTPDDNAVSTAMRMRA